MEEVNKDINKDISSSKECCCCHKTKERSDKEYKDLCNRLSRIEGQIRGINQMIEDDRYCDDVLIQIAAANKALKSLGNHILDSHMKSCVAYEIQMGNLDILEDVMQLIKKLQ